MLRLYRNITPNLSGTHYYFKDFVRYTNFLADHLQAQIDPKRYDINKGFIRVKLDGGHVIKRAYKEVTYIVNTDDETCYHVTSQIIQSDYVYYGVKLDEWGSYIAHANLKNIKINKCNRKLSDNGIYDEISNSDYFYNDKYRYFNKDELMVIVQLKYALAQQGVIPIATYGTISLVGFNLEDISSAVGRPQDANPIVSAMAFVSGIHSMPATPFGELGAGILKAWVVPKSWIGGEPSELGQVRSRTIYDPAHDISVMGYVIEPSTLGETLTIENPNLNDDYIVGGYNDGLRIIKRTSGNIEINISCIIDSGNVKIIASQGNNQKDISSCYELNVSTNDGAITSNNKIAKAIEVFNRIKRIKVFNRK